MRVVHRLAYLNPPLTSQPEHCTQVVQETIGSGNTTKALMVVKKACAEEEVLVHDVDPSSVFLLVQVGASNIGLGGKPTTTSLSSSASGVVSKPETTDPEWQSDMRSLSLKRKTGNEI
jgi:hypothetical protein